MKVLKWIAGITIVVILVKNATGAGTLLNDTAKGAEGFETVLQGNP